MANKNNWRSFEDAKKYAKTLDLKSIKEWVEYCKSGNKPVDIPSAPNRVYKNKGWCCMGGFLGNGNIAPKNMTYKSFEDANIFAKTLKLKNMKEWQEYCKSGNKPNDIPSAPHYVYKNKGWDGMTNFLGTYNNGKYKSFEEAKIFAKSLNLKGQNEWNKYCKSGNKPVDIPSAPYQVYKNKGWCGIGDFLGTGNIAHTNMIYKPFEEAKIFTKNLKLKSVKEWKEYCKSGNKPVDIPNAPYNLYKNKGWVSWVDFLGTGNNKKYKSFEEAKIFAKTLNLKSQTEWVKYCKSGLKPVDIPNAPYNLYKNKGWCGMGDFLGTGNIAPKNRIYKPFEEAKNFTNPLELKSRKEWVEYCKSGDKPNDIPTKPYQVYKNKGWVSWGDFLGTGDIATFNVKYRSFEDAKIFAKKLGLKSVKEWKEYCKSGDKPVDIPTKPNKIYKNKGWISWGDFLGKSTKNQKYKTFEDAKSFTKTLGLKGVKEWKEYCKSGNKPNDMPSNPNQTYKNKGWISWGDFLGTGRVAKQNIEYRSFEDAKSFTKTLGLKGVKEWNEYCKTGDKPNDIPNDTYKTYKNKGWISWGDFLGTGNIAPKNIAYRSFVDAKIFAKILNLKTVKEWQEYCKTGNKPNDIPTAPDKIYKNKGWISWGDFLGTGRVAKQNIEYRSFEDAKSFTKILGLKGVKEWNEYCKTGNKPVDIPTDLYKVYKNKGWISWGGFLGTGNIAPKNMAYRSFEDTKSFTKTLGLKGVKEWNEYCKTGNKPVDIPNNPHQTYKNKGWISWGDFLGNGNIAPKNKIFKPFEYTKTFAKTLGLKGVKEWKEYCKSGDKPIDIPNAPYNLYKNKGWISWVDFLGKSTQNQKYKTFEDAKTFTKKLNLKGVTEWIEYSKSGLKPIDIPNNPHHTYKNKGWKGMGDFLGNGNIAPQNMVYKTFEDAKTFVKPLGLKNVKEWVEYCKSGNKPNDIPTSPYQVYKNKGWKGMGDFLYSGDNFLQNENKWCCLEEAKNFAKALGLNDQIEWREYCKSGNKPVDIPSNPYNIYKNKGWKTWRDFLGNNKIFEK